jgi:hypothetical protein
MDNFIEVYKNAFSDEYCDNLIQFFKNAEESGITINRQEHEKAIKLEKEDLATYIPSFPMHHTQKVFMTEFNRVFWGECYKQYAEKYNILSTCSEHKTYSIKIQKTKPGQGYHLWHAEATNKDSSTRLLAWTAYLNDDFEAGETEFLYQQYRYKPSKGDCIIFPAAFTHTHRGNPPIGGDKYIITGWVEF